MSWFLHLPSRFEALGAVRFDLILVIIMSATIMLSNNSKHTCDIKSTDTNKLLTIIIIFIVFTLPFVEWPGSVLRYGAVTFIKALVFYYFTVYFVTSEIKLKYLISVFLACQFFRILEPLYLHLTQGYWGDVASMEGWEFMDRLSGAPSDVINPNGLAFVILTVIPFLYYLADASKIVRLLAFILIPMSIYALTLTGSRSGVLGLLIVFIVIIIKSNQKLILTSVLLISCLMIFSHLGSNFQDRYLSLFTSNTRNEATKVGRIEGVKRDIIVALRRPIFGHGLGTSKEVNGNFGKYAKLSHNLYAEISQELGFVGLVIFLLFVKSIIVNYKINSIKILKQTGSTQFIKSINDGMQVWLYMNIIFSLASYGLSGYQWYLFAGLSVALKIIIQCNNNVVCCEAK